MLPIKTGFVKLADVIKMYSSSTVHCAVITDQQNNVVFANTSFATVLGYQVSELANLKFNIITDDKIDPSFSIDESVFALTKKNKGYVIQKNGTKALVDYEIVEVADDDDKQYQFIRISNLEAYAQLNHLSDCKKTLENILNNLTSSIVVIDQKLTVLQTNKLFSFTFELENAIAHKSSLQQLSCSFWQNEDVLFKLKDNYHQLHFNFDVEFDWEKQLADNKSFKIESRLINKKSNGDDLMILLIITDITEEKANQSGRNQQIRHIMHELRNPLSNLALCVELLADSTKENNQEDTTMFLSKAGNSIQRMKQLINDLNVFRTEPK